MTCSRPYPTTQKTSAGCNCCICFITCASKGCPANKCNTLGLLEYMRVPRPAARIMIERDIKKPSKIAKKSLFYRRLWGYAQWFIEQVRVIKKTQSGKYFLKAATLADRFAN